MLKKYTLKNDFLEVTILNLGGIIHEIKMPDRNGLIENIIHGFKDIEDYKENDAYFGAIIGRTAGRICKGKYDLNGEEFTMETVDRGNGLHGGLNGFDKKYFIGHQEDNVLRLTYHSPHGEEGFPGNLDVEVIYTLEGDSLSIDYKGVSDRDTLLNMTNHSYFNLQPLKNILDMELKLDSDYLIEIDKTSIPTGKLMDVSHTPFDFRKKKTIGRDLFSDHEQLIRGGGYDHPWLVKGALELSASNGRKMVVTSDQACVVMYSYNFPILDHAKHLGLAIEFQAEPDGIHHKGFNSSILKKGDTYTQKTVYKFIVD
ncbi:galactose mutarotase [Acidaminobacter sp. JC074]|uniref:aldose epimerase family protein n=1 Tax=Acidaminobacter sp. JC074 TaxID=2530199 RepID=UPI001F1019AF|nr:galactose mutarotase [Acidaminobacter sp. JC074]MCH4888509.1 galactose mutarotase [Acidaminobacter sp. JC074]